MRIGKWLTAWLVSLGFVATVAAVPVTLTNANFEAGVEVIYDTENLSGFDGEDGQPDVPGWISDNIEQYAEVVSGAVWWGPATYNDSYSANMYQGSSAYLLSEYVIQPADEFTVSFAGMGAQNASQLTATLFYGGNPTNVIGSFVANVVSDTWTLFTDSTPIMVTDDSIGEKLGILIKVTGDYECAFDDVSIDAETGAFLSISGSPTGTITTLLTPIDATIVEAGSTVSNTTMLYVDGVAIPTEVDRSAAPTVSVSGFVGHLSDGVHTAEVAAVASDGQTSTEEWTFTVEAISYLDPVNIDTNFTNLDFDECTQSQIADGFDMSAYDIPGWRNLGDVATLGDTGVEDEGSWWVAYDTYSAFMQAGDGGYNSGTYEIKENDIFDVSIMAKGWKKYAGSNLPGDVTVRLFYGDQNNVFGSFTTVGGDLTQEDSQASYQEFSSQITAPAAAEGEVLGVIVENTSGTAGYFINFDEVSIDVMSADSQIAEFFFEDQTPTGVVGDGDPTVSVQVQDGVGYFSNAVLYVDGVAIATNDSPSGVANTVSGTTGGLDNGVHTAQVVVASVDSYPATVATNEWTFEVVPFVSIAGTPTGDNLTNSVTVMATIVEGSETVSNSTALYLDGVEVAVSIDRSEAPTTTVSYVANNLVGLHTGKVVAVGSGGYMTTNEWTFTVGYESTDATSLVHHWNFAEGSGTNVADSVGGADGVIVGSNYSWIATGGLNLAGDGSSGDWNVYTNGTFADAGAYVDLPNGIMSAFSNAVTIEVTYVADDTAGTWQRVYDFGNNTMSTEHVSGNGADYVFLAVHDGDGPRIAVDDGSDEIFQLEDVTQNNGELTHNVFVFDPHHRVAKMYENGVLIEEELVKDWPLSNLNDINNWIGRAQWSGDPMFDGKIYDMRIYSGVMTASEAAARYDDMAPKLTLVSASPTGVQLTNNVTLEVVIEEGQSSVSSAIITVDGNSVTPVSITGAGSGTATVSCVASGLALGSHDVTLTVIGDPSGSIYEEWSFGVHAYTTNRGWNLNIAGATGGTTVDVTDGVIAVAPASGSNLWNNVTGVENTDAAYVVTNTAGTDTIGVNLTVADGIFGYWDATADNVNQEMFQATLGTALDVTTTITNLDVNSSYDIYVYSTWRWPGNYTGNEVSSSVTGGYGDTLTGIATQNRSPVQGTADDDYTVCEEGANYVLFTNITPNIDGSIVIETTSNDGSYSGLQIVENGGQAGERAPYEIVSTTPTGNVYDFTPELEAVINDIGVVIATNDVVLLLDGSNVTASATVSKSSSTTTVSYVTAALSAGEHTAAVIPVVGGDTNSWTFTIVPFVSVTTSPSGSLTTNDVTVEAVIVEGADTVNTNTTVLSLDGTPVAADISITNSTVTLSYDAVDLASGVHTGEVVVVGELGTLVTNEWTFSIGAFTSVSTSPRQSGTTATLEAVIVDGAESVDTNSIVLSLDGTPVAADIVSSNGTTTVTYEATGLTAGVHTGAVVAVGDNGGSLSSEWTFTAFDIYLFNGDFDECTDSIHNGKSNENGGFDDSAYDVPGWMNGSVVADSGVENGSWWGTYDEYSAFMASGDSAYIMSEYVVQEGDAYNVSFAAKGWTYGSAGGTITVTLFYDNPTNVIGSYTTPALPQVDTYEAWSSYNGDIAVTPEAVGGTLGALVTSSGVGFANFDELVIAPTVIAPVVNLSTVTGGGSFVFSWTGGGSYNIETNADLVDGSWGVYTNVASPYTNAVGGETEMFYRLSE